MLLIQSWICSHARQQGRKVAKRMLQCYAGLFDVRITTPTEWPVWFDSNSQGEEWKKTTLQTALLFPGVCFGIFFCLNMLVWGQKSTGAVPWTTLFALCFLWFGISVPLVFVGSYFGYKKPVLDDPVRTHKIPRQIPEQAWWVDKNPLLLEVAMKVLQQVIGLGQMCWAMICTVEELTLGRFCPIEKSLMLSIHGCVRYMHPVFSILIGGILPFGAVFIELFFILTSMWLHQFYYLFGFLFLVFVILVITCAEITIVLCYFQLCSEDYHWW